MSSPFSRLLSPSNDSNLCDNMTPSSSTVTFSSIESSSSIESLSDFDRAQRQEMILQRQVKSQLVISDQNQDKKIKIIDSDLWIETCPRHPGHMVNLKWELPPPCPVCKPMDGHGQKARVFKTPIVPKLIKDKDLITDQNLDKKEDKIKKSSSKSSSTGSNKGIPILGKMRHLFH